MTHPSAHPAAQKRRPMPTQTNTVAVQATNTAPRRSARIQAAIEKRSESQKHIELQARSSNFSILQKHNSQAVNTKKRDLDPENHTSRKRQQTQAPSRTRQAKRKRDQEDEVQLVHVSPEPLPKRSRLCVAPTQTIKEARIDFWRKTGAWPTETQEKTVGVPNPFGIFPLRGGKRTGSTQASETTTLPVQSSSIKPRELKNALYANAGFEDQMETCGSFMRDHREGISAESEELCQMLLSRTQSLPADAIVSDDYLFNRTLDRMRGENETKVVRDITPFIVPSAESLADRGAEHLEIVQETLNACWVNSKTFLDAPHMKIGPRPQPDIGLGFKTKVFHKDGRFEKLLPVIGDLLTYNSYIAATYRVLLPFFSVEVKSGAGSLDTADRQNAHTQSIAVRGLFCLFHAVGRAKELHRQIVGFSISHNSVYVSIYGHYAFVTGEPVSDVEYYRHTILDISLRNATDRWKAYTFVRNMYDLWVPQHFKMICEVIDTMPKPSFDSTRVISEEASQLAYSHCSEEFQRMESIILEVIVEEEQAESDTPIVPIEAKKRRMLRPRLRRSR